MPKFNDKLQLTLGFSVMGTIGRSGDCGEVGNIGPLETAPAAQLPTVAMGKRGAHDARSPVFTREAWNCAFMWNLTILNDLPIKRKVCAKKYICKMHQTHGHHFMTSRLSGFN